MPHWVKHLVVSTVVALTLGKLIELLFERETLEAIVHWEEAQLASLWRVSPLTIGQQFWTSLTGQIAIGDWTAWVFGPYKAVLHVLGQQSADLGGVVFTLSILAVGAAAMDDMDRDKSPLGCLAIVWGPFAVIVLASFVSLGVFLVCGVLLYATLWFCKLGLIAIGGGMVASLSWELCQHCAKEGATEAVLKATEGQAHGALTEAAKKIIKLD